MEVNILKEFITFPKRGGMPHHTATGKVLGFGQAAGGSKARGNPSPQPLLGCVWQRQGSEQLEIGQFE